MGRKGVGKLAPFGICNIIEVLSSGGQEITRDGQTGYLTAHFVLNGQDILQDTDHDYRPTPGRWDDTLRGTTGTTITLRTFAYRRVPDFRIFARQLAQRFGLPTENWTILLRDAAREVDAPDYETRIGEFAIATMANTKIVFQGPNRPNMPVRDPSPFCVVGPDPETLALDAGFGHDQRFFPVTGWTAYAQEAFQDDLMAGVRIYCRGKIAAQTAIFNRKAGFTGEHDIRSYLVGELHADWLDEEEDLIQTGRRDILWSHELGQKFQKGGHTIVRQMGRTTRDPMRRKTCEHFLEVGQVQERIEATYPRAEQEDIRIKVQGLAQMLGRTIQTDEVEDMAVVTPLVELTLALAPHVTLDEKLRAAGPAQTPMDVLSGILRTAHWAELSSFGRIVEKRLDVIEKVQILKDNAETAESQLQEPLAYAPWSINPQWAPITAHQSFTRLKHEFERFYQQKTGEALTLGAFQETGKRPDFVLSSQDDGLPIIEIKRPAHRLQNPAMERIVDYSNPLRDFLADPAQRAWQNIFNGFHITRVCDAWALSGAPAAAFAQYRDEGKLTHIHGSTFLLRTALTPQDFRAEARRRQRHVAVHR